MGLGRAVVVSALLVAASWYAWAKANWILIVSLIGVGIIIGFVIGRRNRQRQYVPVYSRR